MKMKYVKFKNNHPSGAFDKDDIAMIPATSLKAYMDSGHVEEVKKKDYEEYVDEKQSKVKEDSKKAADKHFENQQKIADADLKRKEENKASVKATEDEENNDGEDGGNGGATTNESNEDVENTSSDSGDGGDGLQPTGEDNKNDDTVGDGGGEAEDVKYYTLTKNDIEQNDDNLCEGFSEGDEIEVNDQKVWLLGEDNKLIKKQ